MAETCWECSKSNSDGGQKPVPCLLARLRNCGLRDAEKHLAVSEIRQSYHFSVKSVTIASSSFNKTPPTFQPEKRFVHFCQANQSVTRVSICIWLRNLKIHQLRRFPTCDLKGTTHIQLGYWWPVPARVVNE